MTHQIPAFLIGWGATAALLIIFHLLFKNAHRTVRYLLGGGALCVGCSVAGAIVDSALLAFGPWVIASAGLIIAGWTWAEEQAKTDNVNARKNGQIVGMARGLKRELLEGQDAQSGLDETGRRN